LGQKEDFSDFFINFAISLKMHLPSGALNKKDKLKTEE